MNGLTHHRFDRGMMMAAVFVLMSAFAAQGAEVLTLSATRDFSLVVDQTSTIKGGRWTINLPFDSWRGRVTEVSIGVRFQITLSPPYRYDMDAFLVANYGHSYNPYDNRTEIGLFRDEQYTMTNDQYMGIGGPRIYEAFFFAMFSPYIERPGAVLPTYRGTVTGRLSLAVKYEAAPTPEPATWVSAAVGVAMLAGAGWRRSRRGQRRVGPGASAIG